MAEAQRKHHHDRRQQEHADHSARHQGQATTMRAAIGAARANSVDQTAATSDAAPEAVESKAALEQPE